MGGVGELGLGLEAQRDGDQRAPHHTTSALTLKGGAHCANIWSISWILCISGHRDTVGQVGGCL